MMFLYSFQSEWIKKRHSVASALVWTGGFLIPLILLIVRLKQPATLAAGNENPALWRTLYGHGWQFMAFFLLPLGVMLATSLITQLEFRNNTWKQLHTTPQPLPVIFFAKLAVIVVMLLQFFVLFNIGLWLTGVLPALLQGVPYPVAAFPLKHFLQGSAWFFVDCLPIVSLQYLVSMQFRNFLVPLAVGIGLYVASMIAVRWEYGYTIPYTYSSLEFSFAQRPGRLASIHWWALGWTAGTLAVSYLLYVLKRDKC